MSKIFKFMFGCVFLGTIGFGQVVLAQECFIGEVRWFGGDFAPRGWAILQGQLLPIQQNQALFSILGTQYGGDGRTTFGLPDLRGRTAIGVGQGPGLSNRNHGAKGGTERHRLTLPELPSHTHQARGTNAPGTATSPGGKVLAQSNKNGTKPYTEGKRQVVVGMAPAAIAPTGGNQPHENMSPYLVLTPIMCLQGLYPSRN